MFDILLKYILWYEFLNDWDAQSDFDKIFVTKKPVKKNPSFHNYALRKSIHNYFTAFKDIFSITQ